MNPQLPVSDDHALLTGMVLGLAAKHGLQLQPILDDAGNYTTSLLLVIDDLPRRVSVVLTVDPPTT